jgi:transposase-like protein
MTKSTKNEKTQAVTPVAAPQTKRYDDAFKQQAVENWIKAGKPGTQIALELGISYPSLKEWKRRYYGDATPQRDDLAVENRALKAELARVREQRDILKKRWASSPNRPGTLPGHRTHEDRTLPGPALRRLRGEAVGLSCVGEGRSQSARAHRRGPAAEDSRGVCPPQKAPTDRRASRTNWPAKARGTAANASPA